MKTSRILLLVAGLAMFASGCGSTSGLKTSEGKELCFDTQKKFDTVIVEKFQNQVGKTDADEQKLDAACDDFANMIKDKIIAENVFASVSREGTTTDSTLIIGGEITRYKAGNAAARLLVGCGAGSSYFNAVVRFKDAATGLEIGQIAVDKNSWALGGGLASSQTVEKHMAGAATKVAKEATKLAK